MDQSRTPPPPEDRRSPLEATVEPILEFLKVEAAGGGILVAAALAALLWANSPWADGYHGLLEARLGLLVAGYSLDLTLHQAINEGLMPLFFLLVGLEIKRELVAGELRGLGRALLPASAAVGGMIVPALIYLSFHLGEPTARGWAIPMATDIAFAVGIMGLLGSRTPHGLRVFLLAVAIVDDIGSILVIALLYTTELSVMSLTIGLIGLGAVFLMIRLEIRWVPIYLVVGSATWFAFLESGVHPTIAGVLLGLLTPSVAWLPKEPALQKIRHWSARAGQSLREGDEESQRVALKTLAEAHRDALSPNLRFEAALHSWVTYGIIPIFALANAGVTLGPQALGDPSTAMVALAVSLALVVGKPAGILLGSAIVVRLGLARLPEGAGWWHLGAVGVLGGIGFTVALFIATLAFEEAAVLDAARIGTLAGSTIAASLGLLLLWYATRSGRKESHGRARNRGEQRQLAKGHRSDDAAS